MMWAFGAEPKEVLGKPQFNLDLVVPVKGMEVACLGHPYRSTLKISKGKVLDCRDCGTFRHTCATAPGSSGSPILCKQDDGWKLVGIHFKGRGHLAKDKDIKPSGSAISWISFRENLKIMFNGRIEGLKRALRGIADNELANFKLCSSKVPHLTKLDATTQEAWGMVCTWTRFDSAADWVSRAISP